MKALPWVLCSFKPLTLEALAQAIGLGTHGSVDFRLTRFVPQIRSDFIVVTNSGRATFAHRSVMEYLICRGDQLNDPGSSVVPDARS